MRIITSFVTLTAVGLSLVACGASSTSTSSATPTQRYTYSPTPSPTPTPLPSRAEKHTGNKPQVAQVSRKPDGSYVTQTAYAAIKSPTPTPTPSPTEAHVPAPANAYAGAGKEAPESAITLTKNLAGVYAFTTPSGNIGCQFGGENEGCGVHSYKVEGRYKSGDTVNWFVKFNGDKAPNIMDLAGTPGYSASGSNILNSGQQAKAGDYVCASEDTGVTCWNTKTKRGFLVNRDGYTNFWL